MHLIDVAWKTLVKVYEWFGRCGWSIYPMHKNDKCSSTMTRRNKAIPRSLSLRWSRYTRKMNPDAWEAGLLDYPWGSLLVNQYGRASILSLFSHPWQKEEYAEEYNVLEDWCARPQGKEQQTVSASLLPFVHGVSALIFVRSKRWRVYCHDDCCVHPQWKEK